MKKLEELSISPTPCETICEDSFVERLEEQLAECNKTGGVM